MHKRPITYKTFDGVELTEDFYFNLSKSEITKLETSIPGGLAASMQRALSANDIPAVMDIFEKLILDAYGIKSPDGKRFMKVDPQTGIRYADEFKETNAYDKLFMELATDDKEASKFINAVIPTDLVEEAKKLDKANHPAVK